MHLDRAEHAKRGHVAVVGYDEPFVLPAWVEGIFAQAGFGFVAADCRTEREIVDLAADADVVLTSSGRPLLNAWVLDRLVVCRALVRVGSGIDCIDLDAATASGILVYNTPDALAEEVAEHTVALLLALVHRIASQDRLVKSGDWRSRTVAAHQRVRGRTLGLVGLGRIARAVVHLLGGFGLTYLAYDPFVAPGDAQRLGVALVELDHLLAESDIVSFHVPLGGPTFHLIGDREFRLMKPEAVLVNTARGAVVDQKALTRALTAGWIAGAALDVTDPEPPSPEDPLLGLGSVVITPHSAAFSLEALDAMYRAGCKVAIDVLEGNSPNTMLNPDARVGRRPTGA